MAVDYARIESPLDQFVATVRAFRRDSGARGCNVTTPFKGEAFAACTRLSERARRAQAVNTIAFEPEGWFGDNTDGAGLVRDIELNAGVAVARQARAGAGRRGRRGRRDRSAAGRASGRTGGRQPHAGKGAAR